MSLALLHSWRTEVRAQLAQPETETQAPWLRSPAALSARATQTKDIEPCMSPSEALSRS